MIIIVPGPTTSDDDRRVLALSDLARGCVVVAPPPETKRASQLYWELLAACNRTRGSDLLPGELTDRSWPIAALAGNAVRHVFVLHADTASIESIGGLTTVVEDAGATAWLLADEPDQLHFRSRRPRRIGWAEFEAAWLDGGVIHPAVRARPRPTHWTAPAPDAQPWHSIGPSALAGYAAAAAWLPTGDDREEIATHLRSLLLDRTDLMCRASILEGASGPLYNLGWQVTEQRVAVTGELRASELLALACYPEPIGQAGGYLLGRFPIRPEDALDLRMHDVAGDASAVCVDGDWHPVEPVERVMLRGLHRLRLRVADGPHDVFLDAPDFSRSSHNLVTRIRVAYRSVGLGRFEPTLADRPGPAERALGTLGLALRYVARDEREPRGPTGFDVEQIEAEMQAAARALNGQTCACHCAVSHRAPLVVEVPPWPRRPRRPPTGVDHPFRRNAWRHRLDGERESRPTDETPMEIGG